MGDGRWELGQGFGYIGKEALFSCLIKVCLLYCTSAFQIRESKKALIVSIAVRYRYQRTKQAKLYTRTFATRPSFAFNSSDTSVDTVGINQIKP